MEELGVKWVPLKPSTWKHCSGELHTLSVLQYCITLHTQGRVRVHGDSSFCLNLPDTQNPSGYAAQPAACASIPVCVTMRAASKHKFRGLTAEFLQLHNLAGRDMFLPCS